MFSETHVAGGAGSGSRLWAWRATRSPANGAARGSPAPTALPRGSPPPSGSDLDETSVGAADGARPSGIDALDLGTTTTVSPEPIERVSTSARFVSKEACGAWTATEEKDGFIEFLLLLLQPNPRRRPTAAQALAHDWLAGDDDDFEDFEDAWVPPQTASPYGDARERDILAQL